jgi:hypothetical protein
VITTDRPTGFEFRGLDNVETVDLSAPMRTHRSAPALRKLTSLFNVKPMTDKMSVAALDLVLRVWVACQFVRHLLPTRPILILTGSVGSGKTTLGRAIGQALFGTAFQVAALPPSERDFYSLCGCGQHRAVAVVVQSVPGAYRHRGQFHLAQAVQRR